MPKTLQEYADWLDERNLIWPSTPKPEPVKATPYLKPLPGIAAVTWSVYGTLLRITDGDLLVLHPDKLRMQIALEKTIEEFNMWQSMHRKPGAPWEAMYQQYARFVEERRLSGTRQKGDAPEVDAAEIWRKLIGQLEQKDYSYDEAFYGDPDELSEKVAFFFQRCLQGVEAVPSALSALKAVVDGGRVQGLLADAQLFTIIQLLRVLRGQGKISALGELFAPECLVLSYQEGVRKPSPSLYRASLERFEAQGIGPSEILHVGTRLAGDLAIAKRAGMRTALFAGDRASFEASKDDLRDPEIKPDRLLTDLAQISEILGR